MSGKGKKPLAGPVQVSFSFSNPRDSALPPDVPRTSRLLVSDTFRTSPEDSLAQRNPALTVPLSTVF